MIKDRYNPAWKKENVRQVRRVLKMTQKEFLDHFMKQADGRPAMSVATFSNLESKGGERIGEIVVAVSAKMQLDSMMFSLEPREFLRNLESSLNTNRIDERTLYESDKKGNISRLVNRLTMYFADEILEGRLKRGDRIESDRELAKKLNVGRSALREAMKVLDVLGLIDIRLGQGTYIATHESNFFAIPLSWSIFLDGAQITSILEVREALEIQAVRLAVQSADENRLTKLTDIYHQMRETFRESEGAEDLHQYIRDILDSDIEFHTCIAECSENPIILSMLTTVRNFMKRVSSTGLMNADEMRAVVEEHRNVYEAIVSRDEEAAALAMREHLTNSQGRYRI